MGPGGVHLHLETPGETLWAVIIGALLATVGGFVATQFERMMHRHERERNAALVFGGLLSALDALTDVARGAMARGEPYGPLTMRLLRAMRREIEAYERSRTVLYDLHDGEVRTRIHSLMVRLALALEGVSDASTKLTSIEAHLRDLTPGDPHDAALGRQHDVLQTERNAAFTYTLEVAAEIKPILGSLGAIAKQDFTAYEALSGNPFRSDPADGPG